MALMEDRAGPATATASAERPLVMAAETVETGEAAVEVDDLRGNRTPLAARLASDEERRRVKLTRFLSVSSLLPRSTVLGRTIYTTTSMPLVAVVTTRLLLGP